MAYIGGKFHEVQGWGGESEALPPGTDYVFRVDKIAQGQSSTGKPQLELDLVVCNEGELKGRASKSWYTLNFEKDTPRKRVRQLIDATGVQMDQAGGIDDQAFIGRYFVGDVVHEPYQKADPVSGQMVEKTRTKICNERPYNPGAGANAAFAGQGAQQPAFQAQQPAFQPGAAPPAQAPQYAMPPGAQAPMAPGPVIAGAPAPRGAPQLTRV